jgi:phosphoadenosine phosphosulfate reductase
MGSNLSDLNNIFANLDPTERIKVLFDHFEEDQILATSSFGGTSVILLHILSKVRPGFPVYFIDTGYHFDETIEYKKKVASLFNLKFVDLKANEKHHNFTKENNSWVFNQDLCCYINKVRPIEELKSRYQVWISGLLGFQNDIRSQKPIFEQKEKIIKFHPLIHMTNEEVDMYMKIYDLPVHPLVQKGYGSIGCQHCTIRGNGREGRWFNTSKTECGLHL